MNKARGIIERYDEVESSQWFVGEGAPRVYYNMIDPNAEAAPVQAGLEKASGFLRAKLGQAIKVRHVPELRFEHDDSAAEGQRISDLIENALHPDAGK